MDLRKLLHFQAVIDGGSFRAGAARVHISAPALTKSIQTLEAELGEPLFKRRHGQPVLTEAGLLLSQRCQRILAEIESINRDLGGLSRVQTGLVRLGSGPAVAQSLLGAAMGHLHETNPGIQVSVVVGNSDQLLALLENAELDLVVADMGTAESHPELLTEPLPGEEIHWIAHANHPLAGTTETTLAALTRFPLALPRAPRHMIAALQRHHGVETVRAIRGPAVQTDDYRVLLNLAHSGRYLSAAPMSLIQDARRSMDLVIIPVADFRLHTRAGLIRRRASPASGALLMVMTAFRLASNTVPD